MITLERFCCCPEMGTFGRLLLPTGETLYTVEQPWRNNAPYMSCVPPGEYELVPFLSPRWGDTYALKGGTVGVTQDEGKARFACLFHVANLASELKGCIAPGERLSARGNVWQVHPSAAAFIKLTNVLAVYPDARRLRIYWDNPFERSSP